MEHLVVIPAAATTAEVIPVVATTAEVIPAEEALQMMTVQPPLGMEMVVEVIPVLMVQSQLILPMARVPTPMLMAIHSATMEVEMGPILCPMVPLVLILMMDQVLTPMLMEELQP
jgi:hypothetical protein